MPSSPASIHPFLIEQRLTPEERGPDSRLDFARLRPDARLIVTPALRTSGLLTALSGEQAKLLLWLLVSLTPNGRLFAPVVLLANQIGVSEAEVRRRMETLTRAFWDGEPMARHLTGEGMTERYIVSNRLLGQVTLPTPESTFAPSPAFVSPPTAVRDAVIAQSRERYARPRVDVEKDILSQIGHDPRETEDTPEGDLYRRLRGVGVAREDTARLIAEDPVETRQQLNWLPLRSARDPARYLIAAVKGRYAPPVEVRWNAAKEDGGSESPSPPKLPD